MSDFFYLLTEQRYKAEERTAELAFHQDNDQYTLGSSYQRIQESQFSPKAFPDHPHISTKPITSFEELEQILENL